MKAVRPDVQIGGPYIVLNSLDPGRNDSSDISGQWGVADQRSLDVITYWLKNKVGADFTRQPRECHRHPGRARRARTVRGGGRPAVGPAGQRRPGLAALSTDATFSGGGKATPLTAAWHWLVPRLARGDVGVGYSPTLPLLAFRDGASALVVNLTGSPVTVPSSSDPIPAWTSVVTDSSS